MRAASSENQQPALGAKAKAHMSYAVTVQLISTIVFVTLIHVLQFLFYLIPKFKSFYPASVAVQSGLCQTWSETPIVDFLMQRIIPKLKFLPRGLKARSDKSPKHHE